MLDGRRVKGIGATDKGQMLEMCDVSFSELEN